jgi:MoaA/NifB/PqqE/SkfB family radical SAM enzyme
MQYPYGNMSLELFTKVLNQLPDETCIVPFFRGEPLLHPQFPELTSQLKRFKQVQLATNGDKLTPENRNAILENVTFLSISLHDFKLPKETTWLSFLHEARENGLETQVSIVETDLPKRWASLFSKEWLKHVDRIRIYEEHSKNGFGSLHKKEPLGMVVCHKPFEDMVVYWDGKVGLCNHDWNNLTPMGDLNKQSIMEVWQNIEYKTVRLLHENNKRCFVATCEYCDFQSNKLYGELICQ